MTIVNHTTAQQTSLRALLRLFPRIVAATVTIEAHEVDGVWIPETQIPNPKIGTNGMRAKWDDPPTDEQLRTVGYSIVRETERPAGATAGPLALIDDAWTRTWIVQTDAELRARIVEQIKHAARDHILGPLPEWRQANATARALQITRIEAERALTESEQGELAALESAWAWVVAVRQASDAIEADVAGMTRAELDAWTMPALPGWGD